MSYLRVNVAESSSCDDVCCISGNNYGVAFQGIEWKEDGDNHGHNYYNNYQYGIIMVLLCCLIFSLIGGGLYHFMKRKRNKNNNYTKVIQMSECDSDHPHPQNLSEDEMFIKADNK